MDSPLGGNTCFGRLATTERIAGDFGANPIPEEEFAMVGPRRSGSFGGSKLLEVFWRLGLGCDLTAVGAFLPQVIGTTWWDSWVG